MVFFLCKLLSSMVLLCSNSLECSFGDMIAEKIRSACCGRLGVMLWGFHRGWLMGLGAYSLASFFGLLSKTSLVKFLDKVVFGGFLRQGWGHLGHAKGILWLHNDMLRVVYRVVTYGGLSLERSLLWMPCLLDNILRACKDIFVCVFEAI